MYLSTSESIFCRMNVALNYCCCVSAVNKITLYSDLHDLCASILLHNYLKKKTAFVPEANMHASNWQFWSHSEVHIVTCLPCTPKAMLQGKLMSIFIRPLVQLDQKMIGKDELLVCCSYERPCTEQYESHRCPISKESTHRVLFLRRAVCEWTLSNGDRCERWTASARLVRTHLLSHRWMRCAESDRSSSELRVCVWDRICIFSLPLIYNSSA